MLRTSKQYSYHERVKTTVNEPETTIHQVKTTVNEPETTIHQGLANFTCNGPATNIRGRPEACTGKGSTRPSCIRPETDTFSGSVKIIVTGQQQPATNGHNSIILIIYEKKD